MVAHWGFWEWIAYSAIAIAAVISALDLALKHAPMLRQYTPTFIQGPVFALLPFVAILTSGVIFGAEQLGFIKTELTKYETADVTGSASHVRLQEGAMPAWLQVAIGEYDETRGVNGNHNPRIAEYLRSIPGNENADDQHDWASAFAEWSLNKVGIVGPKNNNARAWATWGREVKRPELGAIAVFNFQGTEHVGFVLGEMPDSLVVVGGNEVDRVEARRYYKRDVVTYRMPPTPH